MTPTPRQRALLNEVVKHPFNGHFYSCTMPGTKEDTEWQTLVAIGWAQESPHKSSKCNIYYVTNDGKEVLIRKD